MTKRETERKIEAEREREREREGRLKNSTFLCVYLMNAFSPYSILRCELN